MAVRSPLLLRNFRYVWLGGLISLAGTHMQFVALPLFVYQKTGSTLATAAAAMAAAAPGSFLGPRAGGLADRHDPRRALILANLCLGFITLGFLVAAAGPWWIILVVVALQGLLSQVVGPAQTVWLPQLVGAHMLSRANALNAANSSLARLIGPAVGGLIYATSGFTSVAILNAASFLVAAALIGATRPQSSPRPARGPTPVAPWQQAWSQARRDPILRRLLIVVALSGIGEGTISALLGPFAVERLDGRATLGLVLTCQALGGIGGAAVLTRWQPHAAMPTLLGTGCLAAGALLVPMLGYPIWTAVAWPEMVMTALAGFPFAVIAIAQTTLLQTVPTPGTRGAFFGFTSAASSTCALIGMFTSGVLADQTNVFVILIDAGCYLAAGAVMLTLIGTERTAPVGDDHSQVPCTNVLNKPV